jgi:site-specific DNA-methyltransferase (adenine-specific)
MREVDCVKAEDLTQEQVDKLRLLDNKLNESDWDMDLLLEDIPGLDFSDFDIDWGLPEVDDPVEEVEEDEVPELPDEAKAKKGDLYELGPHRLICGDSTDIPTIERLVDGQQMDLLITDPPYNVALGMNGSYPLRPSEAKQLHRRTDGKIIQNDSWETDEEFIEFLVKAYKSALNVLRPGGVFYIWYAST